MSPSRREFIRTATGLTLGGIAGRLHAGLRLPQLPEDRPRVAILHEPGFPIVDGVGVTPTQIQSILPPDKATLLRVEEAREQLSAFHTLITPYGSCFPVDLWPIFLTFLRTGGHWINLGGAPLSIPVFRSTSGWISGACTTKYSRELGILQSFPVVPSPVDRYDDAGLAAGCRPEKIYELTVRLTETVDFPDEDGPAGTMEGKLNPLVTGNDTEGIRITAPVIEIDNLRGLFAGGRWILVNFSGELSVKTVGALVDRADAGVSELRCRSSFACYYPGERPTITVELRRPDGGLNDLIRGEAVVKVLGPDLEQTVRVSLQGGERFARAVITLKGDLFREGFYTIELTQQLSRGEPLRYETGFWVRGENLLSAGAPLTVTRDTFVQDGKTRIITGTSYMASDVHRKFLFDPNPKVWDEDFGAMKRSGVNMVRTGIWTAWRHYMLDPGVPDEAALRAIEAFVLTARRHEIPLIFTFFAFLPEAWNGENPYLDPRSVSAQKEFLVAIAGRLGMVNDIIWDLINEPSFCSKKHLWYCRPNYDRFEEAAWKTWLKNGRLREQGAEDHDQPVPLIEDFAEMRIVGDHRPVAATDYRLFAQEMFREWVVQMTAAIRTNGNPHQRITVGQDEGGTYERPGPHFFGDAVDFTCLHNWWMNDDLLWDCVVTKTEGKPNLVEETGVMFAEAPDGTAWRSEEEVSALLERKLAVSIGSGGAGFIEWIWNSNTYMKSDNEAAIGLHRSDGTAKPEFFAFARYARFFAEHGHLLGDGLPADVVMVIPHSQMFSSRNLATEATRRAVRALAYHCDVIPAAVSEYTIGTLGRIPRLLLVPNPVVLTRQCWGEILALEQKGCTVLLTGTFDRDARWVPVDRSVELGFRPDHRPVAQEEFLQLDGAEYRVSFRGDRMLRVEKGLPEGKDEGTSGLMRAGGRQIYWCPLPVEMAEDPEATVALYRHLLRASGTTPRFGRLAPDPSVLIMPLHASQSILYTLVSESGRDSRVTFNDRMTGAGMTLNLKAGRTALVLLSQEGKEIARMEGTE